MSSIALLPKIPKLFYYYLYQGDIPDFKEEERFVEEHFEPIFLWSINYQDNLRRWFHTIIFYPCDLEPFGHPFSKDDLMLRAVQLPIGYNNEDFRHLLQFLLIRKKLRINIVLEGVQLKFPSSQVLERQWCGMSFMYFLFDVWHTMAIKNGHSVDYFYSLMSQCFNGARSIYVNGDMGVVFELKYAWRTDLRYKHVQDFNLLDITLHCTNRDFNALKETIEYNNHMELENVFEYFENRHRGEDNYVIEPVSIISDEEVSTVPPLQLLAYEAYLQTYPLPERPSGLSNSEICCVYYDPFKFNNKKGKYHWDYYESLNAKNVFRFSSRDDV